MSESKKMVFKTPEVSGKNMDMVKESNTVRINKLNQLELKSNNSFVDNCKEIFIKIHIFFKLFLWKFHNNILFLVILKSPTYDPSEFYNNINILEEELLSNDLASLSCNEIEIHHQQLNKEPQVEIPGPTPTFPNRMQSKTQNQSEGLEN